MSTLTPSSRNCACISRFPHASELMSLTMLNRMNYERHGVYFFYMPPLLRLFQRCPVIWKTLYQFCTYVTSVQGQLHCVAFLTYNNRVMLNTCTVTYAMAYRSANLTTLTIKSRHTDVAINSSKIRLSADYDKREIHGVCRNLTESNALNKIILLPPGFKEKITISDTNCTLRLCPVLAVPIQKQSQAPTIVTLQHTTCHNLASRRCCVDCELWQLGQLNFD
jgi:hypothetical protein